ncbi:transglycosylase SLT domain-containing protein [Actinacidiphila sp. ITFR-21]|uniref:transglycosylase SLT domain-containing protein n=1 Tax=Actinacidiphila sp. ITFR-21 TaxID=3075199 RepID=UPI0028892A9E|nr:lytic transglycosylase [Streptomyces sp. ITFR-21]WNI14939.1 lytic transglycosylase [Streptomyces sp. ITFR-21]
MQLPTIPKFGRLSKKHKITAAGAAAAAAVVLTVTGLQVTGGSASAAGDPTGFAVSAGDQVKSLDAKTGPASEHTAADRAAAQKKAAADRAAAKKAAAQAAEAKKHAAAAKKAAAKRATAEAAAKKKAAADAAARKKAAAAAAERARERAAANRSEQRAAVKAAPAAKAPVRAAVPAAPAPVTYTDDLDGWIKHSLAIMHEKGIPGSYDGIYRNIIRESSGNPNAINLWDSNAAAGIPSKGLLQVIDPTFQTYHVDGTSWNIYDPVANITAACNYAFHVYGSMDNVNSAY